MFAHLSVYVATMVKEEAEFGMARVGGRKGAMV